MGSSVESQVSKTYNHGYNIVMINKSTEVEKCIKELEMGLKSSIGEENTDFSINIIYKEKDNVDEELYKEMKGYPVTIRFLDPPLHEFVPHTDEEIKPLAKELGMTFEALKDKIASLHEFNPMMGHRGCRLAVTYPEIAKMQTRAVIEAAINVNKKGIFHCCPLNVELVKEALKLMLKYKDRNINYLVLEQQLKFRKSIVKSIKLIFHH